jgi:serine/threonine protein kinase
LEYSWSGPVYQAIESRTGRSVAIVKNDMSNQQKQLFLDQISIRRELEHPNVVRWVASYLVEPDELWIVTDYTEGCELSEIIRNNSMTEDQMSNICWQVRNKSSNASTEPDVVSVRHAKAWLTCTVKASSTGTSARIIYSSIRSAE